MKEFYCKHCGRAFKCSREVCENDNDTKCICVQCLIKNDMNIDIKEERDYIFRSKAKGCWLSYSKEDIDSIIVSELL